MKSKKNISIWFTGLSGSGKTTLAAGLKLELDKKGIFSVVLDADEIRKGINTGLGYSIEDRKENIRRAAELAKLFSENGIININAYICPTDELRNMACDIIGKDNCFFIYLNTPIKICEQRDIKGLYAQARKGEINNFTGIGATFETPSNPDLVLVTEKMKIDECLDLIIEKIMLQIS